MKYQQQKEIEEMKQTLVDYAITPVKECKE